MNTRVLIVGGGRVGRHAAEQLSDDQYPVTVIERDASKSDQVSPAVTEFVQGDGTDPTVLAEADLTGAAVVAALTNDTDVNLTVCRLAHEENPDVRTILRIARDGEQAYGYREFVDDVVYPAAAGATAAVERITRG